MSDVNLFGGNQDLDLACIVMVILLIVMMIVLVAKLALKAFGVRISPDLRSFLRWTMIGSSVLFVYDIVFLVRSF
jgi:hypothetical protein